MNLICKLLSNAFIVAVLLLFFTLLPFRKTGRSALYLFSNWIARLLSRAVLILPAFASGLESSVEGFKRGFIEEFPKEPKIVSIRNDVAS